SPVLPSKAPLFRGGCLRRGGGCRNPRPSPRPGAPSLRAAEIVRYVELKPARQSSAGSVTYVSTDCGTGLLRA
ncbi:MAG: hypothetical protein LBM98_13120, partial [Oscillospiraceae bacterium]|nr:hypothetical protein [Oscillospiraceae bacterium]